jgi:hypothetical protein
MKNRLMKLCVAGVLAATCLFSCKKEDAPVLEKPVVTINEVGSNNSRIAYTGNNLHLDAEVKAPGKVASIKLQITLANSNYGWDVVKTYTTPYSGVKNASFHEHIDVPENARPGMYTLLIVVTDEAGEKAQARVDFEVIKDLSLPSLTGASLKLVSASALNVSGLILAPNKVERVVIEVQSSAWTKEFTYTDMADQTSFRLNKDIDMSSAPSGHYHINITVFDKAGKNASYAFHLDR